MWAEYMATADTSVRTSPCAFAVRARLEIGVERNRDRREDADDPEAEI